MNGRSLTKIVALYMILSLAACKDSPKDEKTIAPGLDSKAGQELVKQTWCSDAYPSETDANKTAIDRYAFRASGEIVKTTVELQTDNSVKPVSEDKDQWSIMNDKLVLTIQGRSKIFSIKFTQRDTDQASCFEIGADSTTQQLCNCRL